MIFSYPYNFFAKNVNNFVNNSKIATLKQSRGKNLKISIELLSKSKIYLSLHSQMRK